MLSRLLTREQAGRAQPLLFPSAGSESTAIVAEESNDARKAVVPDRSEEIMALQRELQITRDRAAHAEREAFARGRQQGQAEVQAELQPVLERLNSTIAETAGLRTQLRRSAERDVVQLALAIARRILHRELHIDESALGALAKFAFERMGRAERYQILVHPRFAASVDQGLIRTQEVNIRIDSDPNLAPGTLVIRTENGALDASVDHQLEEISRGLTDRIS